MKKEETKDTKPVEESKKAEQPSSNASATLAKDPAKKPEVAKPADA